MSDFVEWSLQGFRRANAVNTWGGRDFPACLFGSLITR